MTSRLVVCLLLVVTTGCATLTTNGTSQRIPVESSPPGADVFVNGDHVGETPIEVDVSRRDESPQIDIRKNGFLPVTYTLQRRPSWWAALNAPAGYLAGGLFIVATAPGNLDATSTRRTVGAFATMGVPALIDFLTGGAFSFREKKVHSELVRTPSGSCSAPPSMPSSTWSASAVEAFLGQHHS